MEDKILRILRKVGKPIKFNSLFAKLGVHKSLRGEVRKKITLLLHKGKIIKQGKSYAISEEQDNLSEESSQGDYLIVGRFEKYKYSNVVIPDSKILKRDIYVDYKNSSKAKPGDKVIVRILNPQDLQFDYVDIEGKVIKVLGKAGDKKVELDSILIKYNFTRDFPKEVTAEAEKIMEELTPDVLEGRLDLRKIICFTIDPADSKDFDDAVSISRNSDGYEIGVHIADVSYYVKENSIIDAEAMRRGTSVYLLDSVAPMLPEKLSNNICSLKPDLDRLAFSVFINLNKNFSVTGYTIAESVIRSKRRFSYEEVQNIIDAKKGEFSKEILLLQRVASNLTKKRLKSGSIDFDSKEVKFILDSNGDIEDIKIKERLDSMRLVEEFMLLANKCVTEYVYELNKNKEVKLPFIYRVHDVPDKEKLKDLSEFIKQFGYRTNLKDKNSIIRLLNEIKGKPEEYLINNLVLRSMAKAIYEDDNIGHYGLGFENYTHFTSPIRRYPDLVVHRMLKDYLSTGKNYFKLAEHYSSILPEICKHSSQQEQSAVNAERDTIKIKQTEFLSSRVGCEFDAVISGIAQYGIFVEIQQYLIEGMIRFRDITDDFFEYDERNHCAVGVRKGKIFRAGQSIKVKLIDTNIASRKIDFVLA